jgi:hypothetical protein
VGLPILVFFWYILGNMLVIVAPKTIYLLDDKKKRKFLITEIKEKKIKKFNLNNDKIGNKKVVGSNTSGRDSSKQLHQQL